VDKRIRRNEICVIGLPRCDFVFSSTRTCFIAYGFEESPLEMGILRRLLEERGIQAIEAGGTLAPGQNAFCAKICSKIITAQFCAVLLNNEENAGITIPNANVNMEYGLMLGFNKYVIPLQRASQKLPFNVSGLDTVKYIDPDFERLAAAAIDQAVRETRQDSPPSYSPDQVLEVFLLTRKTLVAAIDTEGDRNLYRMGSPLGFSLLHDFAAMNYMYFGNFTALRPEIVVWRARMLKEILDGRRESMTSRVQVGLATEVQARVFADLLDRTQVWLVVTSNDDKRAVQEALNRSPLGYRTEIFSIPDVEAELEKLTAPGA